MFHFQAEPIFASDTAIQFESAATQASSSAAIVSERLYQRIVQLLRKETGELDMMALVDRAIVDIALSQMMRGGTAPVAPADHVAVFVRGIHQAGPLPVAPGHKAAFVLEPSISADDSQDTGRVGETAAALASEADTAPSAANLPAIPAFRADSRSSVPESPSGQIELEESGAERQPGAEALASLPPEGDAPPPASHDLMMMIFQDHSASTGWNAGRDEEFLDGEDLSEIAA